MRAGSSRLGKFSFYFCVGNLVAVLGCAQHYLWLSQEQSKALQVRFSSLEAYADECEGMEKKLSMRGVSLSGFSDAGGGSAHAGAHHSSALDSPSIFLPISPEVLSSFPSPVPLRVEETSEEEKVHMKQYRLLGVNKS